MADTHAYTYALLIPTGTAVPVLVQPIARIALTVEGGNLIDTHLLTTAIGCATLVNIWITNMGVTNNLRNNRINLLTLKQTIDYIFVFVLTNT